MDDILGAGLLLYLSPVWLSELYHQIINTDFLGRAGYHDTSEETKKILIKMLTGELQLYFTSS